MRDVTVTSWSLTRILRRDGRKAFTDPGARGWTYPEGAQPAASIGPFVTEFRCATTNLPVPAWDLERNA
jgi:hypothetical protein